MSTQRFIALSLSVFALNTAYAMDALMAGARAISQNVRDDQQFAIACIESSLVYNAQVLLDHRPRPAMWNVDRLKKKIMDLGNLLIDAGITTVDSSTLDADGVTFGKTAPLIFKNNQIIEIRDILGQASAR